MTALHDPETDIAGIRFDAFLKKPLEMDELLSAVRRLSGNG